MAIIEWRKAIDCLLESLSDGNSKNQENYEEILAENLKKASRSVNFYSLPFSNICSLVKKSKTQNVKTLIDVILGLYRSDHKNIPVLLEYLDLPELKIDDCIHIISSFKSSPVCVHTGNIYEEYSIRPEIEWKYALSEKEKEISKLKSEIEAKQIEIAGYNIIKDENQREITNLNSNIKDMQDEITKLLKNNEEKLNEIKKIVIKNGKGSESSAIIFEYDGFNKFSGIIEYLSSINGGNVFEKGIVRVEATSPHSSSYSPLNDIEENTY